MAKLNLAHHRLATSPPRECEQKGRTALMIQSTKLKRARNDTRREREITFARRSKTVSLLQCPATVRKSIQFIVLSVWLPTTRKGNDF